MTHLHEAINTLNASSLTLFMAGLFGKKIVLVDEDGEVVLRRWRRKSYLIYWKNTETKESI